MFACCEIPRNVAVSYEHLMLKFTQFCKITAKRLRESCVMYHVVSGSEEALLQSADLAILLTASRANGGIGGQVD